MKSSVSEWLRPLPTALTALVMLLIFIGILIGRFVLPPGSAALPGTIAHQLLSWDGRHYYYIMRFGYSWNPNVGELPGHYQQIEFFPVQPILDEMIRWITGSRAPILMVLLSLGLGIASIYAMDHVSRSVMTLSEARWTTIFFALWPVSSFYVMGYPTGLITICIIFCLGDHNAGRYWRSAAWCGLGTATAPTMVFVAFALGLHRLVRWLAEPRKAAAIPCLVGWGIVCIWGILGFMIYQAFRFHDPFAFSKAAAAWGGAPPFGPRLSRLFEPDWYTQQAAAGLREIDHGLGIFHSDLRKAANSIQFGVQRWINTATMLVVLIGLIAATVSLSRRAPIFVLAGWTVFAGYLWFIVSTDQNMLAAPRLLMPAVALFMGLGWLSTKLPHPLSYALGLGLSIVSIAEVAFAAGGYWVV
ncbi:MAG: mannosyltransferase family protein [Acidiphilium sp.]|nr:mannosyltransferase family protein [Acidiphilium sp.]